MPRDGSGTYTLPAGNPVVSGTIIDVTWANPTMTDVAAALTDSLSRTGSGGMLVPFLNADGAVGSPGISWVNETTSGLYRAGLNDQRFSSSGVDKIQITADPSNPLLVWNVGDASWRPVLDTFSPATVIGDWTFQGALTMEGPLVTDDSTLTRAGFNIPIGVEPTAPVQGDMWVESGNIYAWLNGVAESLIGSNAVGPSTDDTRLLRGDGSGGWSELQDHILVLDGADVKVGNTLIVDGTAGEYLHMSVSSGLASFSAFGSVFYLTTNFEWRFQDTVKIAEQSIPPTQTGGHGAIWVSESIFGANPGIGFFQDDNGDSSRIGRSVMNATLFEETETTTTYNQIGNFGSHTIRPQRRYSGRAVIWYTQGGGDIKLRPTYDQTAEELGHMMWQAQDASGVFDSDVAADFETEVVITTLTNGQISCVIWEFSFQSHDTNVGTLTIEFACNSAVSTTRILEPSWFELSNNDNQS